MFMLKVTCLSAQEAIWITTNQSAEGMPLFRKAFEVEKKPETAKLYATALGVYDVSVNGKRVGNHELKPGWTDYRNGDVVSLQFGRKHFFDKTTTNAITNNR